MKKTNKSLKRFAGVVIWCLIAGPVADLSAGDFDEDIRNTSNIVRSITDNNEKSQSNSALESYSGSRERVLNALLDILRRPEEPNASNWSSQIGNGKSALRSLEDKVSKDKFRDFLENEKRMWDHLERTNLRPAQGLIIQQTRKIAKSREELNEKWNRIERDDEANDAKLLTDGDKAIQLGKDLIVKTSEAIERFPTGTMPPSTGVAELDGMITISTAMINYWAQILETLRKETLIWEDFRKTREAARKIHEEIHYSVADKSVSLAEGDSVPGDRKDYLTFKNKAVNIIKSHRDQAKNEYDKFMNENKGKFVDSLETRWSSKLIDQSELDFWKSYFELHSRLDSLLAKHEDGWKNVKDSQMLSNARERLEKLTGNSRTILQRWKEGKELYEKFEGNLA
jgi:hypothetical protein